MKSIIRLCAGVAFASLAAPTAFADEGPYLRIAAGTGLVDEDSFGQLDFEPGYVGSAAIGYNWFYPDSIADLRVELEGSYRQNDVDELFGFNSDGRTRAFSAMVNGYFDLRTSLPFVPYFGAGIGATHLRHEDDGAAGLFTAIDDEDTVFAYQVMGGANVNLASGLAFGVEYRFLETEKFEFTDTAGGTFRDDYNQHSLLLTITLGF